ncbi:MAG: D-aminoacyl-tRNA deacylase [Patescibacteria group bacterium]
MRAVVQRVGRARVTVDGRIVGEIGRGLAVLLGVGTGDTEADAAWLAGKVANLRILEDGEGRMNLSPLDTKAAVLVVSQFTLYGDCRNGRRPDFTTAARPEQALPLYRSFCQNLRQAGLLVAEGEFGAHMILSLDNDGPVTVIIESGRGA